MLGTTLGMLLANVPVVLIGKAASAKIPFKAVRIAAALLFAALGVYALSPAVMCPRRRRRSRTRETATRTFSAKPTCSGAR